MVKSPSHRTAYRYHSTEVGEVRRTHEGHSSIKPVLDSALRCCRRASVAVTQASTGGLTHRCRPRRRRWFRLYFPPHDGSTGFGAHKFVEGDELGSRGRWDCMRRRDVALAEAVNGSRLASHARTKWRLPTALLIRPVSAIGKRYVMTAGMRFQYQTIAV